MKAEQVSGVLQSEDSGEQLVILKAIGIEKKEAEIKLETICKEHEEISWKVWEEGREIRIRLAVCKDGIKEAERCLRPLVKTIRKQLDGAVYSVRAEETLEMAVLRLLKKYDLTVSTAESITGGMIAARITSVPGASEIFKEGFVTYSNKAKRRTLSVKKEVLKRYGAVSAECVKDMAMGGMLAAEADLCIAVTGNAGPDAMDEKQVGLVYLGCCCKGHVAIKECMFSGSREEIREQTVDCALNLLRKTILAKYRKNE